MAHQISDHREGIADYKDQLFNHDERIVEEIIDVLVAQVMKQTIKAQDKVQIVGPKRVSERIEEQIDVPVTEVMEQIVAVLVRQIRKEIGRGDHPAHPARTCFRSQR